MSMADYVYIDLDAKPLLTGPSMSLACEAPDFDQSIVGGSNKVETRGRETHVGHVPAKLMTYVPS